MITSWLSSKQARGLALNLDECCQLISLKCNRSQARADVKLSATFKIAEIDSETKNFFPWFFGLAGFLFLYQELFPHHMHMAEQDPHSIQNTSGQAGAPLVDVVVRSSRLLRELGKNVRGRSCVACHGANAAGQDGVAPPLVHIIYEPNHHGDQSFYQAVRYGVSAHHWRFGDMPAIEGVSPSQVADIIIYVREL